MSLSKSDPAPHSDPTAEGLPARSPDFIGEDDPGIFGTDASSIIFWRHSEAEKRAQAEEALRASEEKFRSLFESINEGFAIIEVFFDESGETASDYRYLEINPAFERHTGLLNAAGMRMREVAPRHTERWFELYGQVALTGEPVRFEHEVEPLERWLDVYALRVGEPEQRRVGVLFNDITERKHAEEALRAGEEKFRSLFESIDEGFAIIEVLFDASGKKAVDYRFLETNPAFTRHTGLVDVIGRSVREMIPQHDEHWYETYGRIALTGEPERFENRAEAMGRDYDVYAFRIGDPAEHKVAILFTDITRRRQTDDAVRASEARQTFLLHLADAMRPLTEPRELLATAVGMLGRFLHVNRASYVEVQPEGETLHSGPTWVDGVPELPARMCLSDYGEYVSTELRAGRPISIPDVLDDHRYTEAQKAAFTAISTRAALGVPLVRQGHFVAVLSVNQSVPRQWATNEMTLLQEAADRIWAAVETTRAIEALRASEEKYRTLFESMDEGVMTLEVILDEEGNVVDYIHLDANPALERHSSFGFEIIGKRVSEIYPEVSHRWLDFFGRVVRTGEPERMEEEGARGAWFDVYASRVGGADSRKVVCVYNNITERKRREENRELLAEVDTLFPASGRWQDLIPPICRAILAHFDFAMLKVIEFRSGHGPVTLIYDSLQESMQAGAELACRLDEYFSPPQSARLRVGEVVAVDDTRIDGLPDGGAAFHEFGPCSILGAPYLAEGKLRFLIAGVRRGTVPWRPDEMDLLRELAARLHLRVERSRADAALREAHDQLEARVDKRTGELENALWRLRTETAARQEVESQRADLLQQLMRTQEEERLRISHDLHDNLGQHMVGLKLSLGELEQHDTPEVFQQRMAKLRGDLEAFINSVRRQAWELRPAELEHLGLQHALRYYVNDWSERTGIDVAFLCEETEPPDLPSDAKVALYRVTQESLTNVHRHASASSVIITLAFQPCTIVSIEDDGVGFDPRQGNGRLGLLGMRERMMIIGGTLEIECPPGNGAKIIATLAK